MKLDAKLKNQIEQWNDSYEGKSVFETLEYFLEYFGENITFATSLGAEDQVITDFIARTGKSASIFTLDTGRLFPETYDLLEETSKKYGFKVDVYFPDRQKVESMVKEKGINLFYESVENRKMCCGIRKVESLQRAFSGKKAWISGLRKDQTVSRFFSKLVEWDDVNNLIKLNPLINWTEKDVWEYIKDNNVPYNPLHKKGFVSIGCQPCTRAIKEGEDFRAGRWWWEDQEQKECGLHKR
ncbi:MAG TPA: phosphoadenylyl-sulfate reductase [Bacteroidales bacterium]|nr:phosphoadenylyl-sulfate reductase [Bacteroidales bacterium]